jgi:hypothetical protein
LLNIQIRRVSKTVARISPYFWGLFDKVSMKAQFYVILRVLTTSTTARPMARKPVIRAAHPIDRPAGTIRA